MDARLGETYRLRHLLFRFPFRKGLPNQPIPLWVKGLGPALLSAYLSQALEGILGGHRGLELRRLPMRSDL